MNNMDIWSKVERTDPDRAKKFNTGKMQGVSPNAVYNFKRATELFGPAGSGWLVQVVDDRLETIHIGDREDTTHVLSVDLHWNRDSQSGVVRGYGQTPVCYPGRNGPVVDYDYMKKSYTDAVTNALKQLGFSADVWMGLYDDNAYVEQSREFFKQHSQPEPKTEPDDVKKIVDDDTGEIVPFDDFPENKLMKKAWWVGSLLKESSSNSEYKRLWEANRHIMERASKIIVQEIEGVQKAAELDDIWREYEEIIQQFPKAWKEKIKSIWGQRLKDLVEKNNQDAAE